MKWYDVGLTEGRAARERSAVTDFTAEQQCQLFETWLVQDDERRAALLELDAGNVEGDACPFVRELDSDRGRAFTDAWAGFLVGWPEVGQR